MIQQQPTVSILMTAYNREKYIAAAIESVLASTYSNFELIITDDQSRDKTVEIAQHYAEKDQRVKVFVNKHNLGDYPNRNMAASYARGKYLKYVDADDYIYPWGLQHLVEMMEQFPEAGWGLCSLIQIKERPYPILLSSTEAYQYNYIGGNFFAKAPLSSIIKRDLFEKVNGFKHVRMVGDFEMWHRLAAISPVLLMPDGMVWYREHNEQEMVSYSHFLLDYERVRYENLISPSCPLDKHLVKSIWDSRKKYFLKQVVTNLVRFRLSNTKDNLQLYLFVVKNRIR